LKAGLTVRVLRQHQQDPSILGFLSEVSGKRNLKPERGGIFAAVRTAGKTEQQSGGQHQKTKRIAFETSMTVIHVISFEPIIFPSCRQVTKMF
jgi:hypothetical protein